MTLNLLSMLSMPNKGLLPAATPTLSPQALSTDDPTLPLFDQLLMSKDVTVLSPTTVPTKVPRLPFTAEQTEPTCSDAPETTDMSPPLIAFTLQMCGHHAQPLAPEVTSTQPPHPASGTAASMMASAPKALHSATPKTPSAHAVLPSAQQPSFDVLTTQSTTEANPLLTRARTSSATADALPTSQASGASTSLPALPAVTGPQEATKVLQAPLGSPQWQHDLSQQIIFHRQGTQTLHLRLHPEELGELKISMSVKDDHAQLLMLSNHSPVRAALEAAIPQLRQALADQGIQLGNSQVGQESPSGHSFDTASHHAPRSSHLATPAMHKQESDAIPHAETKSPALRTGKQISLLV